MGEEVPRGLRADPAIDEWLKRQQSKRTTAWPERGDLLRDYREAISRLEGAVGECPAERWTAQVWEVKPTDAWMSPAAGSQVSARSVEEMQVFGSFWYVAFHCIFYLDFYLSQLDEKQYRPPRPFGGPEEHDVDEHRVAIPPFRDYTKAQLLKFLARGRDKAESVLGSITVEQAGSPCPATSANAGQPFSSLLRINLDHVREHGGQLRASLGT